MLAASPFWLIHICLVYWDEAHIWAKNDLAVTYLISQTIYFFLKLSLIFFALYITNRFWNPED